MDITTLGTSHGDATYCRFNSSTLYRVGGRAYLVDCGEPADALLLRAGLRSAALTAVFVTHMHGDHAGGLDALVKGILKHGTPGQSTEIWLPEPEAAAALQTWLRALHITVDPKRVRFRVSVPGAIYDDGVLRVSAIPTEHMTWSTGQPCPSYAYRLEAEGKRILHTGDLTRSFADFPAGDDAYDLCLCEATHYTPPSALPLLAKARLRRLLFIHIGDPWHGPMGEAELLRHFASLPYPVAIARDGDRIQL